MADPRAENCKSFVMDASGKVTGVQLGVTPVVNAKYEVYSLRLIPEAEAGGNTVATCTVLDSRGVSTGEQVRLTWTGSSVPFVDSGLAGNGQNVHVIVNGYSPPALGPLALHTGGFNQPTSDIAFGFGLPFNRHISFVVIFIEKGAVDPDTNPELAERLAKIEAQLIELAKAELLDDVVDTTQTTRIAKLEPIVAQLAVDREKQRIRMDGIVKTFPLIDAKIVALDTRLKVLESGQGGNVGVLPVHRVGCHWIPGQVRQADIDYMNKLRPGVIKVVSLDPARYRTAQAALDTSTYSLIVARDHALSEQKDFMKRDPVGCGRDHALQWRKKFDVGGILHDLNPDKMIFCGINEPDVHNQAEEDIVFAYTKTFLTDMGSFGLRSLIFNFSVGWVRNLDTETVKNTKPTWKTFEPLEDLINSTNSFIGLHEYWRDDPDESWYQAPNGEKWGWNAHRHWAITLSCPIIIGECGLTKEVAGVPAPGQSKGWIGNISADVYAEQLVRYADKCHPNVLAVLPFTTNFESDDWKMDDTLGAHSQILARKHSHTWTQVYPIDVGEVVPPPPGESDPQLLIVPKYLGGIITGFLASLYRNAANVVYAHEGLDLSKVTGTPVYMPYDGVVAYAGSEVNPYGLYVRTYHRELDVFFFFAHLSAHKCKTGDVLKQGTLIGLTGSTGNSTGPHLHFEVRGAVPGQTIYMAGYSAFGNARLDILSYIKGLRSAKFRIEER